MDPNNPNNTQPQNTQPVQQPSMQQLMSEQSVATPPPPPAPSAPIASPMPQVANNGGHKKLLLVIILLILIIGIGGYVLFSKNQLKTAQESAINNNTKLTIPTVIATPMIIPATVEEINIASPDAELQEIESDVQGL